MKISVLGAGGWGTTLALLLYGNSHDVTLWEFRKDYADTLAKYRENFYYLPKVKIPEGIKITNDLEYALTDKDILLIVTPTQYIRSSFKDFADFDVSKSIILSASKGIENNTLMLVSDIISDVFTKADSGKIACLSGPSHAEEVARKVPTTVVCGCENEAIAEQVQNTFSNKYFRVYRSNDLRGTEIGGAFKNVIAIAAGVSDGAGYGDNTKAAIITRGMSEIKRLGLAMGADKETFYGLSGMGDLIVTCTSKHSRNRFVGEELGKGRKLNDILADMKMVAEGVATTKSIYDLSKKYKIELPITEQMYDIMFKDRDPSEATQLLMGRDLKHEND